MSIGPSDSRILVDSLERCQDIYQDTYARSGKPMTGVYADGSLLWAPQQVCGSASKVHWRSSIIQWEVAAAQQSFPVLGSASPNGKKQCKVSASNVVHYI
ncbi:hypothetical protein Pst134EA_004700 [Puccinia striiformis f. sp. tritici]|uniref:hypothetical protein n=1 Tax=Puccinia striiformis f. sp. tritici TaxID=168172 RepID=UPI00200775C8|nr:hypothetical protein Pst134EA_004700 [Puccinia striiformis f. sp. tritici]KAH9470775.1 hypothetical protein Pst134EA_004700 [Puccinia striiformis f. sp. tritici]